MRTLVASLLLLLLVAGPASAAAPTPPPIEVLPGVAVPAQHGAITFTGGGFQPGSVIRVSVNGTPLTTTLARPTGAFVVTLHLKGAGDQSLAATGTRPGNRPYVVTASIHIGSPVVLLPKEAALALQGPGRVYRALGAGMAAVLLGVLTFFGYRLMARRPRART
jgi:hypothetical protein